MGNLLLVSCLAVVSCTCFGIYAHGFCPTFNCFAEVLSSISANQRLWWSVVVIP